MYKYIYIYKSEIHICHTYRINQKHTTDHHHLQLVHKGIRFHCRQLSWQSWCFPAPGLFASQPLGIIWVYGKDVLTHPWRQTCQVIENCPLDCIANRPPTDACFEFVYENEKICIYIYKDNIPYIYYIYIYSYIFTCICKYKCWNMYMHAYIYVYIYIYVQNLHTNMCTYNYV